MKNKYSGFFFVLLILCFVISPVYSKNLTKEASMYKIYYFVENYPGFEKAKTFNDVPETNFLPGSSQRSVAGFVTLSGDVLIAINNGAPLCFSSNLLGQNSIKALEKDISKNFKNATSGLTIGTVFSKDQSAFFHVYRDLLFYEKIDENPKPVLLEMYKQYSSYKIEKHYFDFQTKNTEWEPVELIAHNRDILISWKYMDDKKTRFRYIIHDYSGNSLKEVDSSTFRDSFNIINADVGNLSVKSFASSLKKNGFKDWLEPVGDIYLRVSDCSLLDYPNGVPAFYYVKINDETPMELNSCVYDNNLYVLTEDSIIACGENSKTYKLPELPPNFSYRKVWTDGLNLLISWEERKFPFIGRAGVISLKMSDTL